MPQASLNDSVEGIDIALLVCSEGGRKIVQVMVSDPAAIFEGTTVNIPSSLPMPLRGLFRDVDIINRQIRIDPKVDARGELWCGFSRGEHQE